MVSISMIAMFLAQGLVAQAADPPGEWVVIASKDGPFSFAMPARPLERSGEAQDANGTMRWKMYTYQRGEDTLVFRQQILPPGLRQDAASRLRDVPDKGQGVVFTKAPINVQGVSGMELITKEDSPTGKGKETVPDAHPGTGPDHLYHDRSARGPGKSVPPEAAGFFNSLRFDGKPAMADALGLPSLPARRKQIGKIDRDDRTADAALRTFPQWPWRRGTRRPCACGRGSPLSPTSGWLLRAEMTTARKLEEVKDQVRKARVERLKQGDRVRITPREVHVILPAEVGRDRAALKIQGEPAYAPLQIVKGRWKVDPAPFIAARKAATGSR